MGNEAVVITSNHAGLSPHEVLPTGAEVYRLPCVPLLSGRLPMLRRGPQLVAMRRELLTRGLDGMLINTRLYQTTLFGLDLGRRMGIRPFVLDHGSSYVGFGVPGLDAVVQAYERWMTRRELRYAPDFYGISSMSVAWLRTFGIEAKGEIRNAIDVDEFEAIASARDFRSELGAELGAPGRLLVAFTGRIVAAKGVWKILDVARAVAERGVEATFVLAGDGPEAGKVGAAAPDTVRLVGRLERADVSALMHQADLFIFPSDTEGLPTSVLEASAAGLSSLATNVGGMRDILPSEDYGLVLEEPDVARMADYVAWAAAHPDVLHERGARCRELVRRDFSWRVTALATLAAADAAARA